MSALQVQDMILEVATTLKKELRQELEMVRKRTYAKSGIKTKLESDWSITVVKFIVR